MKKLQVLILAIMLSLTGMQVHAQGVIAEDKASNYPEALFDDPENLGTGFGEWRLIVDAEEGDYFVGPQTAADMGENAAVIDTDELSFSIRPSMTDNEDEHRIDLGREFAAPLEDGHEFSVQIAWSWQNGDGRSLVLYDGSWDEEDIVLYILIHEDAWFINGDWTEDTEWGDGWREEGEALDVSIKREDGDLHYSIVGITDVSYVNINGVIEDATVDRINFYNDGGADWDSGGNAGLFFNNLKITDDTETSAEEDVLAREFMLDQNYPNPFNPVTNITYSLEQSMHVTLSIYDVLGREVKVLEDGVRAAGRHNVQFDAADLHSGIYIYRLSTEAGTMTRTMTLVK